MKPNVTRRALVRGAAWTAPAVVAAAVAPALAASGCPSFTAQPSLTGAGLDRITLTNTGTGTILAAGTTITWTIKNTSGASRTYTISNLVGLTVSPTSITIANGNTATFTFTLTANWVSGATVRWDLNVGTGLLSAWVYQSRIAVTTAQCPAGRYHCISGLGTSYGTTCPDGTTARMATAAPSATGTRSGYATMP